MSQDEQYDEGFAEGVAAGEDRAADIEAHIQDEAASRPVSYTHLDVYKRQEQISAGTRAAAALVDRWTLSLAYGDDELPREVTAAISACIGSCVAVAVSLAAATDAITPTAAALAAQPSLLTEAGPAVGMCRRFILAAHGSLTGLVDDLESAGRLCRSSPVLRLVDGGTS